MRARTTATTSDSNATMKDPNWIIKDSALATLTTSPPPVKTGRERTPRQCLPPYYQLVLTFWRTFAVERRESESFVNLIVPDL
ncbi:hypothetical protein GCM10025858_36730 [Alicyclobacillus sacchari]|nr:hypothetical protein GCM10025858_00640 [Alicyclobacillus sacchari]GMA59170.1 hypothetical protein GCM10025858_36730 [Alicyclobacillus sacchari]